MQRGDILLFHRPSSLANFRRDPVGTLFTAIIHFSTKSRWNHAAIACCPDGYVEATSRGVVMTDLDESADEILVVPVSYDDEEDREDTVSWAEEQIGTRYGYFNAFWCGLRNMFPGAVHIKHGDSIICSELVAEALQRAGYDFDKDSALVSPGDLASAFGAQR